MKDIREISLEIGDPPLREVVTVALCESSASLSFAKMELRPAGYEEHETTIHIPWSEIAAWVAWLAEEIEDRERG